MISFLVFGICVLSYNVIFYSAWPFALAAHMEHMIIISDSRKYDVENNSSIIHSHIVEHRSGLRFSVERISPYAVVLCGFLCYNKDNIARPQPVRLQNRFEWNFAVLLRNLNAGGCAWTSGCMILRLSFRRLSPAQALPGLLGALRRLGFAHIVLVDDRSPAEYAPVFRAAQAEYACVVLRHAANLGKGGR